MLKPNEIRITDFGTLLDTFGKAELEAVGALIVRWHQVHQLAEWTPVSRADIATLFESDDLARGWARNPFWRPDHYAFNEGRYIDGWCEVPEAKGELTQKFHEAIERRAQKDRERGQRAIT